MKLTLVQTLVQAILQLVLSVNAGSCALSLLNLAGIGLMTGSIDSRVRLPNVIVQMSDLRPQVTTIRKEVYCKLDEGDSGDEDNLPTPFSDVSLA